MNDPSFLPRRAVTLLLVSTLAVGGVSCTSLKRSAISSQVEAWMTESFPDGTDLTKVAEGVYSYRWGGYRNAFVATPEGVIVFDPMNDTAAAELAEHIRKVAPNPEIKYVVYTHSHRDHASGGRKLPGSPRFIAHANAARDIQLHANPDIVPPTDVFAEDTRDLTLGGVTVQLIHLPQAHTDGMLAVLIPSRQVMYSADLVLPKGITPFPLSGASFFGVKKALAQLASYEYSVFVPGHGPVGTRDDVAQFAQLINDLEASVRDSLRRRAVEDPHQEATFIKARQQLAQVFFDVEDALRPKYEALQGFDGMIFPMAQWCFYGILMGDA
jgi:glyoxylase-like metal-dependent hydrolase (beta-lactamase superfamily II)